MRAVGQFQLFDMGHCPLRFSVPVLNSSMLIKVALPALLCPCRDESLVCSPLRSVAVKWREIRNIGLINMENSCLGMGTSTHRFFHHSAWHDSVNLYCEKASLFIFFLLFSFHCMHCAGVCFCFGRGCDSFIKAGGPQTSHQQGSNMQNQTFSNSSITETQFISFMCHTLILCLCLCPHSHKFDARNNETHGVYTLAEDVSSNKPIYIQANYI